jgi:hypothetical protein
MAVLSPALAGAPVVMANPSARGSATIPTVIPAITSLRHEEKRVFQSLK